MFPARGTKVKRAGYWTDIKIKRSDFGMNKMLEAIGDPVYIAVGVEAVWAMAGPEPRSPPMAAKIAMPTMATPTNTATCTGRFGMAISG